MRLAPSRPFVADGCVRPRSVPPLLHVLGVLLLSCFLSFGCSPEEPPPPTDTVDEPASALAESYHFEQAGDVARAHNEAHAFDVEVRPEGAFVQLDEGRLRFGLQRMRRSRHVLLDGEKPTLGRLEKERVTLQRSGVVEYFVNDTDGLEHGFELANRPAGKSPLSLEVGFDGCTTRSRQRAIVVDCGEQNFRYDRLVVWDAHRRPVDAFMVATATGVRIQVDDDEARYPIVIDPTLTPEGQTSGGTALAGDRFGAAVEVTSEMAFVGAPYDDSLATDSGAVYVFVRSGGIWTETAKLVPNDPTADQHFGASINRYGDRLLIGAPGDPQQGTGMGAAYYFTFDGSNWTLFEKYLPQTTGTDYAFGSAVAAGDDEFFIGSPGEVVGSSTTTGAVHTYVPDPNDPSGTDFQFGSTIQSDTPTAGDRYGATLAFDTGVDLLAVGLPGRDSEQGEVQLLHTHREETDPLHIHAELLQNVTASDGAAGDQFGASISVVGESVLVGAPNHGSGGAAYLGRVVIEETHGTSPYTEVHKFVDTAGTSGALFGSSVAHNGPVVAIGAPADGAGVTVVYSRDTGGVENWGVVSRESSSTGTSGDEFGFAVAIGLNLVVGAPDEGSTGQVHFLRLSDEPIAIDDDYLTEGTGSFSVGVPGVLGNDLDSEGDPLTATLVETTPNGTLTFNSDGSFSYQPDGGFVGTDTFTYTASDGTNTSNQATVSIEVPPDNSAPDAVDDSATTPKNTAITIDVLANDSDPDGDTITLESVTVPNNGSTAIVNGQVEYTPNTDFSGSDSFSYTVSDGTLDAVATVIITVTTVNQPPTPTDDFVSTDEDVAVTFDPTTNDTDPEGDTLTVDSVEDPVNGTITISGNDVTYTPDANFTGLDRFNYTVVDTDGNSATAQITVGVNAVGDPPVAVDDSVTVDANTTTVIDVLANDSDPDSNSLTINQTTTPSNGTVAIVNDQIEYTPDDFYSGPDSFDYTIQDPNGLTDTATVSVTVLDSNSAPVFDVPTPMGTIRATAGDTITFTVYATDVDGDTITYGLNNPPPSDPTLDATTGDFQWMTTSADSGNWALEFTASDGTDTTTTTVYVEISFTDEDDDGVSDDWESANGLDPTSPDTDGDGILDGDEVGPILSEAPDTDGDGTIDALDLDSDGDGISDADEAGDDDLATPPRDTDDDGTPDFQDLDSDGDGVEDDVDNCPFEENEDQANLDGDMAGDVCDNDADGDGILDVNEAEFGLDPRMIDTDGDNIADGEELGRLMDPRDTDDDGTIDALDEDSDDDGILDVDEEGDGDPTTPAVDTDGDGLPDYRDLDSDDDGIPDADDNCVTIQNAGQEDADDDGVGDACSGPMTDDRDMDGVPNDEDNCPDTRNADQTDTDDDGQGDACDDDDDGDGVPDAEDNCPELENPEQVNTDEDEQGDLCDPDDDNDGVLDDEDNCPVDANADQADEDGDGEGDVCDTSGNPIDPDPPPEKGCCTQIAGNHDDPSPLALLLFAIAAVFGLRRRRAP